MVGFYPTTLEPMASLVAQLKAAEREEGVLSVSFAHGFPWGDTPDTGSRVLVIADGDEATAAALAERLGREIYAHREALLPRYTSIPDALDEAAATPGLVVLGDTADNPGGGAPGDNPAMLRAMLARGCKDAVLGAIWDPVSAATAADAGLGATLGLRLGGKCGEASGEPLDVRATVRAIRENHEQGGLGGSRSALGLSVWLDVEGIDVVVCSTRAQVFAPDAFTSLGIDLAAKRLAVVKSSQHFEGGFGPIAARLIRVATPGAIQMDFATMPYRKKRDLNFHPRVDDPLA
jgi:microcystin degradation protein MlrC